MKYLFFPSKKHPSFILEYYVNRNFPQTDYLAFWNPVKKYKKVLKRILNLFYKYNLLRFILQSSNHSNILLDNMFVDMKLKRNEFCVTALVGGKDRRNFVYQLTSHFGPIYFAKYVCDNTLGKKTNEAAIIKSLDEIVENELSYPKVLYENTMGSESIMLTLALKGKHPVESVFKTEYMNVLKSLIKPGEMRALLDLPRVREMARNYDFGKIADNDCNNEFEMLLAELENVRCVPVVEHGDFSFWNILLSETKIGLVDWEYAELKGVPCADLFHFFLQNYLSQNTGPNIEKTIENIRGHFNIYMDGAKLFEYEDQSNEWIFRRLLLLKTYMLIHRDFIENKNKGDESVKKKLVLLKYLHNITFQED